MHKIETLREQCQVISERQMLHFQEAMKANTKNLEDVFKAAERSGSSLEIMQLLMVRAERASCFIAFDCDGRCLVGMCLVLTSIHRFTNNDRLPL